MVAASPDLFGWSPNPDGVDQILADPTVPVEDWTANIKANLRPTCLDSDIKVRDKSIYAPTEPWQRDFGSAPYTAIDWRALKGEAPVLLYKPLLELMPSWRRGNQGIGDCVSWGWELLCTILSAVQIRMLKRPELWRGPFATEPIYGGSRVEVEGGRQAGYQDGSYGGAAAKFVSLWGALLRQNYSVVTGNPEHDLTTYDKDKAKQWGNYGCGGKNDGGKLDLVAKERPVRTIARVTDFDAAALSIINGYGVAVCSGAGFTRRGQGGFLTWDTTWMHCMYFIGVRFDTPALLLVQSWGPSPWGMETPHWPDDIPQNFRGCTGWVRAADVTRMLRGGDSYAGSDYAGFVRRPLTWEGGGAIGRRSRLKRSLLLAA